MSSSSPIHFRQALQLEISLKRQASLTIPASPSVLASPSAVVADLPRAGFTATPTSIPDARGPFSQDGRAAMGSRGSIDNRTRMMSSREPDWRQALENRRNSQQQQQPNGGSGGDRQAMQAPSRRPGVPELQPGFMGRLPQPPPPSPRRRPDVGEDGELIEEGEVAPSPPYGPSGRRHDSHDGGRDACLPPHLWGRGSPLGRFGGSGERNAWGGGRGGRGGWGRSGGGRW